MIGNDWDSIIGNRFDKINKIIINERKRKIIFPKEEDVLNAFKFTNFTDIKVVILGQDPYHGKDEAMGLAFSVRDGVAIPPSLKNIFKELKDDLGIERKSTNLIDWAKQGVFLLNTVLTVEENKANSHKNIGWQEFTDYIIKEIDNKLDNIIFVLWGKQAQKKKKIITNPTSYIIEASHPSPLSAYNGFFGSKPFSKINTYLKNNGDNIINF